MTSRVILGILVATSLIARTATKRTIASQYFEMLPRLEPGCLRCDGGEMEFRLPDRTILSIAFNDTSLIGNSSVESVRIGEDPSRPECFARRYPTFGVKDSFVIVLAYTQCGFRRTETSDNVTYSNDVFVTVLQDAQHDEIVIEKKFQVEINCVASLRGLLTQDTSFIEHITVLPSITVRADITFRGTTSQEIRPFFGNARQTNVYLLRLELDSQFRSNYTIIGNRCWATPTSSPTAAVQYEFIAGQGCNQRGPDFVQLEHIDHHQLVYALGNFRFREQAIIDLWFHCEINVCLLDGDQARCSESCPVSGGRSGGGTVGADYQIASHRMQPRSDLPSYIIVDLNGEPVLADTTVATTAQTSVANHFTLQLAAQVALLIAVLFPANQLLA